MAIKLKTKSCHWIISHLHDLSLDVSLRNNTNSNLFCFNQQSKRVYITFFLVSVSWCINFFVNKIEFADRYHRAIFGKAAAPPCRISTTSES